VPNGNGALLRLVDLAVGVFALMAMSVLIDTPFDVGTGG